MSILSFKYSIIDGEVFNTLSVHVPLAVKVVLYSIHCSKLAAFI